MPTSSPPDAAEPLIVEKHPRAVRWMHWISFPLLSVMVWSGLLILWAYDPYRIGWGSWTLVELFPRSWLDALGLDHGLARGMAFHYLFGWLFTLNGVAYVVYTAVSGEWRHLVPDRKMWKEAFLVVLHDLHLRRELPPQGRYNAAQRITYTAVIAMGAGSVITGLAIYKPTQLAWLAALLGGYQMSRTLHFVLMLGFMAFFVVHIAQVVRAGWADFRGMVTGYEPTEPGGTSPFATPGPDATPSAEPPSATERPA